MGAWLLMACALFLQEPKGCPHCGDPNNIHPVLIIYDAQPPEPGKAEAYYNESTHEITGDYITGGVVSVD